MAGLDTGKLAHRRRSFRAARRYIGASVALMTLQTGIGGLGAVHRGVWLGLLKATFVAFRSQWRARCSARLHLPYD